MLLLWKQGKLVCDSGFIGYCKCQLVTKHRFKPIIYQMEKWPTFSSSSLFGKYLLPPRCQTKRIFYDWLAAVTLVENDWTMRPAKCSMKIRQSKLGSMILSWNLYVIPHSRCILVICNNWVIYLYPAMAPSELDNYLQMMAYLWE